MRNTRNELSTIAIYVTLDKQNINFYKNEDLKSNFKSIPLTTILKLSRSFQSLNCFDINYYVQNEIHTSILCAKSLGIMKNWTNAITEFKECDLQINYHEMTFDFDFINSLSNSTSKLNM